MYSVHDLRSSKRARVNPFGIFACVALFALCLLAYTVFFASESNSESQLTMMMRPATLPTSAAFGVRGPVPVVRDVSAFGRGDKRTKKGKRFAKSHGNCRQRKGKANVVYLPQPPQGQTSAE
mmetsp:Transcript_19939/g.27791  ORF Transcript_19939/g.27791 Transcript_19939/m.27791 type:complete len:122 (-) Transcript_19939:76-441(-)